MVDGYQQPKTGPISRRGRGTASKIARSRAVSPKIASRTPGQPSTPLSESSIDGKNNEVKIWRTRVLADATEENNGKLVKLSKREQPESDPESSPEQGSVADEAATSDEECESEEERVKIAAVDQENDPKLGASPRSMPSGLQTQIIQSEFHDSPVNISQTVTLDEGSVPPSSMALQSQHIEGNFYNCAVVQISQTLHLTVAEK